MRRSRQRSADASMTVTEHLAELRTRLVVSLVAFALASALGFVFFAPLMDLLLEPLCSVDPDKLGPQGCDLVGTKVLEGFQVRLKLAALVGIVASSPVWLYELWAFVSPGLHAREKRYALPFVLTSVTLFVVGIVVAYKAMPAGLDVLIGLGGGYIEPFFRAADYLNFVGLMLLGFGLTFELPLVLFFLGLAGVVTPALLRAQRKLAGVGIVALAAVVTPTQDPYTLLALSLPLYALYELAILLLALVARRRRNQSL